MEYCDVRGHHCIIQAHSITPQTQFAKEWLTQEINGIQNQKKNILASKQLCQEAGVPLLMYDSISVYELDDRDYARDLQHHGPVVQNRIAHKFVEAYNDI
jgi:hypothetical protein